MWVEPNYGQDPPAEARETAARGNRSTGSGAEPNALERCCSSLRGDRLRAPIVSLLLSGKIPDHGEQVSCTAALRVTAHAA